MRKTIHRQRHFPYQHPLFGKKTPSKNHDLWKNTIYYCWWSYLKRNESYIKTCNNNGRGANAKLYKDFGDVRDDNFRNWWTRNNRGANLFAEPPISDTMRIVTKDEIKTLDNNVLLIRVPLDLPKRFLIKRLSSLLKKHHAGKRGQQNARRSQAKYQFRGQPKINALHTALLIYDKAKEFPEKKLWQLGEFLPQFKEIFKDYNNKGVTPDTVDKKIIEATVSRYKRKAAQSIKNVASGLFP